MVMLAFKIASLPCPSHHLTILSFLNDFMYTTVWNKYLPVLRIVLKRSLVAEQMFALNVPDFKNAGMTRKTGYKFLLKIKGGKLSNVIVDSPLASNLATTLLEDATLQKIFADNEFHISLNPKFELTIKHIPGIIEPQAIELESQEV